MEFTLNGEPVIGRARRRAEPARAAPRGASACARSRTAARRRARAARARCIVDGHGRRLLRPAGDARRGQARRHPGRALGEDERQLWAECFVARWRVAVRLLLAGDRDEGGGAARQAARARRERRSRTPCSATSAAAPATSKVIDAIELAAAARRGEPLPEARPQRRGSARAPPATEGTELALGDNAVRRRHGGARDAPRRASLLGPPAGSQSSAIDTLEGRGSAGRRGRRDRGRRARRARAGPADQARLAPARRRGRDDGLRRRRARRRRGRDASRRPRGRGARRRRVRGPRAGDGSVRGAGRTVRRGSTRAATCSRSRGCSAATSTPLSPARPTS